MSFFANSFQRYKSLSLICRNVSKNYRNVLFATRRCKLTYLKTDMNMTFSQNANKYSQILYPLNVDFSTNIKRCYSKRKKGPKQTIEEDSESDEEENYESLEAEEIGDNFSTATKSVPSMRIDTITKAAFKITKKKAEKEFYASKLRLNGEPVLKKSFLVSEGDEIDLVKDHSPDNERFLLVDRAIVKSIGKISGSGNYPVRLQVFKNLTIEDYPEPYRKSTFDENS